MTELLSNTRHDGVSDPHPTTVEHEH
jgi:hypothetical protein